MVSLQDLVARIWLRFTILLFRSVFPTVFMLALRYPYFPREVSSGLLVTGKITNLNVCKTNIPPPPNEGYRIQCKQASTLLTIFEVRFLLTASPISFQYQFVPLMGLCFPLLHVEENYMWSSTS